MRTYKEISILCLVFLISLVMLFYPYKAYAYPAENQYIFDSSGLLSQRTKEDFYKNADMYYKNYNVQLCFISDSKIDDVDGFIATFKNSHINKPDYLIVLASKDQVSSRIDVSDNLRKVMTQYDTAKENYISKLNSRFIDYYKNGKLDSGIYDVMNTAFPNILILNDQVKNTKTNSQSTTSTIGPRNDAVSKTPGSNNYAKVLALLVLVALFFIVIKVITFIISIIKGFIKSNNEVMKEQDVSLTSVQKSYRESISRTKPIHSHNKGTSNMPYEAIDGLLTDAEKAFFKTLSVAVDKDKFHIM